MNIRILICIFFLIFSTSSISFSANYYVSASGNDLNPGSLAQPWKTLSKAANTVIAGDTVFIRKGTYREQVIPINSGTATNPITYKSYPGETVTIDGQSNLGDSWSGVFIISEKQHITLSGVKVINAGPHQNNSGILIENSMHIIIEKCHTYNTVSSGIGVWNSQHVYVRNNEVELACNDGEQECITIAETVDFEVFGNHVHHAGPGSKGGEGIDIKDGSSKGTVENNTIHDLNRLGIYVDAWDKYTHDIVITRNKIYNSQNDGITLASEQGGLLQNITVYNNIVYDNGNSGISVTPNGDVHNPPMQNISITNNTFYNNGNDWGCGIVIDNPNIDTLSVRNNIFSNNLSGQIVIDYPVISLSVQNNLLHEFKGESNEIKGDNPILGNPLFINADRGDFHLQASSPAIDTGISTGAPATDFDGNQRPRGSAIDIGAFEQSSTITGANFLLLSN